MIPQETWQLPHLHVGREVHVFDQLDSTSTLASQLSRDRANAGIAVLAREQTAGRGQHGRSWSAPPGSSVLLSVLLFPPPELRRPALLTAWAAVSVCETIRAVANVQARIKWPNDVLIDGQKVCGILIEQGQGTVAGIGLNINQTADDFAAAGLPAATSLACASGQKWASDEVAKELLRRLDGEYAALLTGDLVGLESCWKWRLGLLGREVVAECHDRLERGRLLDVGWAGVELETAAGCVRLAPETVRHLHAAG